MDSEVQEASAVRAQEPAAAVDHPAWEVSVVAVAAVAVAVADSVAVVEDAAVVAVVVVVAAEAEGGNEL